jgi:outer membrane protein OmpA-like peptidoglycan-associated protein
MNRFLVIVALSTVLCGDLLAQAPAQDMSVDDLVKALTPQRTTTRGLRNLKVEPAKVDLVINFDFDSARIQNSSEPQLERLATAMKLEQLQNLRFQVEGHTDGKGSASYNQVLSEKRAQAIASFLSQKGVSPRRLVPVGKGFSELLNKDDPNSPENRRVRITAIDQ